MAEPRFYDNRGPFTLAELCGKVGVPVPEGADGARRIDDVASLDGAIASHLTFFLGHRVTADFSQTSAGVCLVSDKATGLQGPAGTVLVPVASVQHAYIAVAEAFYPDCHRFAGPFNVGVDPSAKIGEGVLLGSGVVVGPGAEIGEGTRIGPNTVIGRGVAIGRHCEIGGNSVIACAFIGDAVSILPGAQIGQPGFGFASGPFGHAKIPQLGRVIVQDKVEIGACVAIDRGALGDTVIGEGTKIDNLVQIGHNTHIGRHCIVVSQVGISGSTELGDFVVLAGQVGISDHTKIGPRARLGGKTGTFTGQVIEGGRDYGGIPAKPVKDWLREISAVGALIRKPKRGGTT